MRGPAPAPPRFIALGFPERVMMRCVRVLVQKKSDAVGITLSANLCAGARVAGYCIPFSSCQGFIRDADAARSISCVATTIVVCGHVIPSFLAPILRSRRCNEN